MRKTLHVIEQRDAYGEFQPISGKAYRTHEKAAEMRLQLEKDNGVSNLYPVRIVKYIRQTHD